MKKLIAFLCAVSMLLSVAVFSGADAAADKAAADAVAELIDAIYVQARTKDTDAQCAAAKAAWDALTDEQKELVEGEEASPDYFGLDTGDASLDDPRNADEIGEKEILVVSFGTSFNGSRVADIKGIEDAIAAAFPDWSVRRAFTAQIIINHVQARDGEFIDNMDQALERAVANGVKQLLIQPTHLMHGAEYDELMEAVAAYADKFESVVVAEPLLGEVGKDATVINADKAAVAEAVVAAGFHLPNLPAGAPAIAGRVHDNAVVPAATADFPLDKLTAVVHNPVNGAIGQAGGSGIFFCPGHHALGGIHMVYLCPTGSGGKGRTAGIGEQIQHPHRAIG